MAADLFEHFVAGSIVRAIEAHDPQIIFNAVKAAKSQFTVKFDLAAVVDLLDRSSDDYSRITSVWLLGKFVHESLQGVQKNGKFWINDNKVWVFEHFGRSLEELSLDELQRLIVLARQEYRIGLYRSIEDNARLMLMYDHSEEYILEIFTRL